MADPSQPRLPPELERLIFEMAARSARNVIKKLMRVAHRVLIWLEPIQYEVLILDKHHPTHLPSSRAQHVRHLLVPRDVSSENIARLISQSPNLQDLALWLGVSGRHILSCFESHVATRPNESLDDISPYYRPRAPLLRLSIFLQDLFRSRAKRAKIDFNHEIFKHLTHFEVLGYMRDVPWEEGNNIACLKELKFLAFVEKVTMEFLTKVLEECEKLELLVLWPWGHNGFAVRNQLPESYCKRLTGLIEKTEEKVVVMLATVGTKGGTRDWQHGTEGKEDFWVRGQKVLEQRRRKKEKREELVESVCFGSDEDFNLGHSLSIAGA